jgi:hypothetical protein
MTTNGAITVLGSGPSRNVRPDGLPIAAISSGFLFAPVVELLITVDKCRYFPRYDGTFPVHVPAGQHVKGWNPMEDGPKGDLDLMCILMRKEMTWCPGWADFEQAQPWPTEWEVMPSFGGTGQIGLGRTMNSMVFGVQVLDRMGYRRLHFAGCDMHELNYAQAFDGMEWMYEQAKGAGHEWTVTTKHSRLSRFMPVDSPPGFIPIHREKQEATVWR